MKRSTPMKRTPFRRKEGPTAGMERRPMAKAPAAQKCKHCKKRLGERERGIHTECVDGWYAANRDKLARAAERKKEREARAERAQDRARRQALKTIPDLIADAQEAFNAFIRVRDADKTCFVCDRPFIPGVVGRNLHAGHVRSRGAAGHLRFHEDNCHGECEGCNGPHGAKPHQIEAGAIRRIGQERFDALKNDNTPRKWTREELIALKAHYRAALRDLLKARAQKEKA